MAEATSDSVITVVLVDDHALFREGLREILEADGDIGIVGEAGDSESAVAVVARTQPDVVLLDVEIPGDEVTETVARIGKLSQETRIIILSMYDWPQLLTRLLAAGIRGYLLKSVHRHELIAAVRSVYEDASRIVLAVSTHSLARIETTGSSVLSDKELEVLQLVAQALSNVQIARCLGVAEATVKWHMRNIFVKLNAVSRIDAVNKALAASLISPHNRGDGD